MIWHPPLANLHSPLLAWLGVGGHHFVVHLRCQNGWEQPWIWNMDHLPNSTWAFIFSDTLLPAWLQCPHSNSGVWHGIRSTWLPGPNHPVTGCNLDTTQYCDPTVILELLINYLGMSRSGTASGRVSRRSQIHTRFGWIWQPWGLWLFHFCNLQFSSPCFHIIHDRHTNIYTFMDIDIFKCPYGNSSAI